MSAQHERIEEDDTGLALAPERPKLQPPRQFYVVLLNDDFTPMDFVVQVLVHVFAMSEDKAAQVMLDVHHKGSGVAGIYSREIAETKIAMVHEAAKRHEHPMRCDLRPA